ncbi:MAG: protease complex subunit PrcB family protein [Eubacteriales bacterium]|nr:protease complex subunit PrcB family protein [Eubacteriales bacterium]
MKRLIPLLLCIVLSVFLLTGCNPQESEVQGDPLEFTVLTQEEIPAQLLEVIESHKQNEIQMSYKIEDYLYIVRGYGQQDTGGYSIAVNSCVLAEDGIHVDFSLLGPQTEETIAKEPSNPYLVIKLEYRDTPVLFD